MDQDNIGNIHEQKLTTLIGVPSGTRIYLGGVPALTIKETTVEVATLSAMQVRMELELQHQPVGRSER